MKNQVLTIDQMKHLKELGVDTSKASMYHQYTIPVFTLQDMLELMPKRINAGKNMLEITFDSRKVFVNYSDINNECFMSFCEKDILEALYQMLCWLAENDYLNN